MMSNNLRRVGSVFGFNALLLLTACQQKSGGPQMQNAPVAVVTQEVTLTPAAYYLEYPGTVVPLNQVDIRPQVSGYINGIFFKDGDRVHKGEKLYSIDAQMYTANYEQAVANVSVQQTNLVKAQKDADRYHQLEKSDAIAKQQVDYADAALDAAKKQVDAAKSNAQSLQTSVNYATIYAPFDGTIGISQVKAGTAVSAGVTLLNSVSTDDPMAVDFSIDQKEIYPFTQLLQSSGKKNDSTFTIAFSEKDIYPFPGQITFLDRSVDPQTGTLKVRLSFPNKTNLLRAGMSCSVRVLNTDRSPVVIIPYKAITEQLGEYFVYVVNGDKVSQHKIIAGTHIGSNLVVKSGIKEHDIIVIDGVQKLHEGATVQTGSGNSTGAAK